MKKPFGYKEFATVEILRKLDKKLTVSVKDLASELNITIKTIRKDFDSLADSCDKIILGSWRSLQNPGS